MALEPLGDRVVVKVTDEDTVLASGLILPDSAKEKPQVGEVLAVGEREDVNGQPVALKVEVGDQILFSRFGGTEVTVEKEDYLILREVDILARIK